MGMPRMIVMPMAIPAPIRRRLDVACPLSAGAAGVLLASACCMARMQAMRWWWRAGRRDGLLQANGILTPFPRIDVDICILNDVLIGQPMDRPMLDVR